jgi:hypothetical protein
MSDSESSCNISPNISGSDSASGTSSPSPPLPEIKQLELALATKSDRAVLGHCLGLSQLDGMPPLADKMIVVNFDTENWVRDRHVLTEVGVSTFDSRDMRGLANPGMYGENLLKQVYFYHARILENAHLVNIKWRPGDPDS